VIVPLESFIKSDNAIQTNFVDLYMINAQAILSWLHRRGLYNSLKPPDLMKQLIREMTSQGCLEYIIKADKATTYLCQANEMAEQDIIEGDEESLLTHRE